MVQWLDMAFDRIEVSTPNQAAPVPGERPILTGKQVGPLQSGRGKASAVPTDLASKRFTIIAVTVTVLLGLATGTVLALFTRSTTPIVTETVGDPNGQGAIPQSEVKVGAVFGAPDEENSKDSTEGVMILGGIQGEGSHTLLRPGGASQNVYLTSSVVDLNQFQNMRVRIWGETFKGQKAGWLMDVIRLEVLEINAPMPAWYAELQGEPAQ